MKSSVRLFTVTVVALLASGAAAYAQTASPAGQWDAVVTVSNNTIEIPFRFEIVSSGSTYRGYFFDGEVVSAKTRIALLPSPQTVPPC